MMMDGRNTVMRCSASSPSPAESVGEPPRTHEFGETQPGARLVFDDQNPLTGGG